MKAKLKQPGVFGDAAEFSFDFYTKIAGQAGHPLKIFSAMIDPNNPPAPGDVTRYEENYGGIVFSGTWSIYNSALCSGGAEKVSNITNSYAEFKFIGTGVRWLSVINSNQGIAEVLIDGISQGIYDCYAPSYITKVMFEKLDLSYGWHTIKVRVTGTKNVSATDIYVCIDAFEIIGSWQEITNQAVIDRLKEQNELPITSVDYVGKTAVYNGQTYIQQGLNNPAVCDDFAHKIAGVTTGLTVSDHCPHITYRFAIATTLKSPLDADWVELVDGTGSTGYGRVMTQDGTSVYQTSVNNGAIPQFLVKKNIVAMWEDKFGLIPVDRTGTAAEILARQVEWLKGNVGYLTIPVWIYGLCPIGNMARTAFWKATTSSWLSIDSTTATIPTKKSVCAITNITDYITTDGYVYGLIYTDAASTTSPTLLVLTAHGLGTSDIIENVTRAALKMVTKGTNDTLITPSIVGQVAGDSIKKYHYYATRMTETGTTETNVTITNHGLSVGDVIYTATGSTVRKVTAVIDANNFTIDAWAGLGAGSTILLAHYTGTQVAEATVIPSTIYLDYCDIELQAKVPTGYIGLVSPTPRRDAGLANVLFMTADYRVEETDPNIIYSGNWSSATSSSYSNGGVKYAKTAGYYAEFTFVGTGIRWIGIKRDSYGYANVVIDGGTPTQVDGYSVTSIYQAVMFEKLDLAYGQHKIRIDVLGTGNVNATDFLVAVDAFDVLNTNTQITEMYTGNSVELESLTNAKAPAYLVECSLQVIADAQFGGSNASLKAALKSYTTKLYGMAQGALNGSIGYMFSAKLWHQAWALWLAEVSSTGSGITEIALQKLSTQSPSSADYMTTSNKLYILICSKYPSDGTIPSSLSLDFMSIKVQLTRSPDIAVPKPIFLPQYYTFTLQGFAPVYDSNNAVKTRVLLHIQKDANNYIQLNFDAVTKKFNFVKCIAGIITTLSSNAQSFNKYQVHSIAIAQTTAGMVLMILKNGGAVEKYTNADVSLLTGTCSLYLLTRETSGSEADAFYFRLKKEDLLSKGWQDKIPDDVTDGILKGTYAGYQFPTLSGTLLIFPNNKYHVEGNVDIYINDTKTRTVTTGDFTTTAYENKAVIASDSTLKLVM